MGNRSGPYLITFDTNKDIPNNPQLLRIILSEEKTRIDFGYLPVWYYIKGGWITIAPTTYIQVEGSAKKYNLMKAIGIPVTPEKWEFESKKDWKVFTLLFEPIPIKNCTINIIESLEPDGNFFNYFDISLSLENRIVCMDQL